MAVERTSIVIEEYLQMIYAFTRGGQKIKSVQLSERLKSSPSTVHATLSRMQRDGLIKVGQKKQISLTDEGQRQAEELTRRHQLAETFLCDHLGIEWHQVHLHAHVLEHGLTPLVEEKLAQFLGFPEYCPHGSPIPGGNGVLPEGMVFLDSLAEQSNFSVVMVQETLEDEAELMVFLERHNLRPGESLKLIERIEATESLVLESNEERFSLPMEVASKIGILLEP